MGYDVESSAVADEVEWQAAVDDVEVALAVVAEA